MKSYIAVPLVLLIYLGAIAYFAWPGRNNISYTQYFITLGVSLAIIAVAAFFWKKKGERKKRGKEK